MEMKQQEPQEEENSNIGHGGSKDLQKALPLAASSPWPPLLGTDKNPY